ncbi:expressed unknown protein [Seminavis robusta]|uniref:Uncharacterized protein n=1 Tax=Seminavis robusta TaxID=568900 RepID=A0A9N8EV61_9STRA|nr:expressed unknown protein [Seminavis robusta]|eukprot:Sro1660_g289300.1 n/a (1193) ;mRNA; r:9038-12616
MAITNNGVASAAAEGSIGPNQCTVNVTGVSSSAEPETGIPTDLPGIENPNTSVETDTVEPAMVAASVNVSPSNDTANEANGSKMVSKAQTEVTEVAGSEAFPKESQMSLLGTCSCVSSEEDMKISPQPLSVARETQSTCVEVSPSVDEPAETEKPMASETATVLETSPLVPTEGGDTKTIARDNTGVEWALQSASEEMRSEGMIVPSEGSKQVGKVVMPAQQTCPMPPSTTTQTEPVYSPSAVQQKAEDTPAIVGVANFHSSANEATRVENAGPASEVQNVVVDAVPTTERLETEAATKVESQTLNELAAKDCPSVETGAASGNPTPAHEAAKSDKLVANPLASPSETCSANPQVNAVSGSRDCKTIDNELEAEVAAEFPSVPSQSAGGQLYPPQEVHSNKESASSTTTVDVDPKDSQMASKAETKATTESGEATSSTDETVDSTKQCQSTMSVDRLTFAVSGSKDSSECTSAVRTESPLAHSPAETPGASGDEATHSKPTFIAEALAAPSVTEKTSTPIDLNSLHGLSAARKNGKRKRDEKAPFHFLMLPPSEQPPASAFKGADSMLLTDPKLRRDYLSRRFRAYNPHGSTSDKGVDTEASSPIRYCTDITLWSGASSVERALIESCELPPLPKHQMGAASEVTGGSLARGLEIRFAGLVAEHCHDIKSRLLALAILERSLEQDQREAREEEENENAEDEESDDKKSSSDQDGETGDGEEDDQSVESSDDSDDDDYADDDWDPKASRRTSSRRSRRLQTRRRVGRPPKNSPNKTRAGERGKQQAASSIKTESDTTNEDENDEDGQPAEPDRMLVFFSAGGLKILKNWLMEAMTKLVVVATKSAATKELRSAAKVPKHKPSEYGPMLIPLLNLLSKIPFNKELVMESKINKQIRRLSKQVDGLIKEFKKSFSNKTKEGGVPTPGLDTFVDPEGGVGGCVVVQVQEILNKLKKTWEEEATKTPADQPGGDPSVIKDPFETMKGKLRERLKELDRHKSSEKGAELGWLKKIEELDEERERKRPRYLVVETAKAVKAEESEGGSTEHLALKEREAERAALKDKLKAAQAERKAHLARLKSQISKRIHGNSISAAARNETRERKKRKRNGKSVKWKDGLTSDKTKNRELLEEVFLLTDKKETAKPAPAEPVAQQPVLDEEPTSDEPDPPQPAKEEEVCPRDLDPHGLFDFDETLLL